MESVKKVLIRFQEIKEKFGIPTQICVLAHVTTQMDAVRHGAPTDLIFQSISTVYNLTLKGVCCFLVWGIFPAGVLFPQAA